MHRILIIEDDLVIAKGLQSHLGQWGYQVDYVLRQSWWSRDIIKTLVLHGIVG